MTRPPYDMTLEQFQRAQREIYAEFENAKQAAENEVLDEFGEYFARIGFDFDIDKYVVPYETIPVKVLHPDGEIQERHLQTYDLEIPEFQKQSKIWRWHSESDGKICDECAELDGAVFLSVDEMPKLPLHPNCRCTVTEDEIDENGKTINSKLFKGDEQKITDKQTANNMKMSDMGIEWLKQKESVVKADGKHVIYDDNTGKPVPAGVPLPSGATIGYGHLVKPGEDFSNGLSDSAAVELLRRDIATAERAVKTVISAPISQNQYDALVSLAYNIGSRNFRDSTVIKYINNPDFQSSKYPTLEIAWKAWNRHAGKVSKGLINRRKYEWDMFEKSQY